MKPDGDPVELLSGTIFKRYIVEACSSLFYGPENSEKVTVRQ